MIIIFQSSYLLKLFLENNDYFLLKVICCFLNMWPNVCVGSSLTDRQIEISSDWSLEFVLPTAVKDSLGFERRLTLIFLAWLCDGWGTCLWLLTLTKIVSYIENKTIPQHTDICVHKHRFQERLMLRGVQIIQ